MSGIWLSGRTRHQAFSRANPVWSLPLLPCNRDVGFSSQKARRLLQNELDLQKNPPLRSPTRTFALLVGSVDAASASREVGFTCGIVPRQPFPSSRRSCRSVLPEWRYGSSPSPALLRANALGLEETKPHRRAELPR